MSLIKNYIASASLIVIASAPTIVFGQDKGQLTPPSIGLSGAMTGFSAVQGAMVAQEKAKSSSGSACGQYVQKRKWRTGVNKVGTPKEFFIGIGIATTDSPITSPAWIDDRYAAFREAWMNANENLAKGLEAEIASKATKSVGNRPDEGPKLSKGEQAQKLRAKAAGIKEEKPSSDGGVSGVLNKGARYLNALLESKLKERGHDLDAERKARNEKNVARKRELEAKAAALEAEQKKIVRSKEFREVISAAATERMKGIYTAFTGEVIPPGGKGSAQLCVVLKYSKTTERWADMMAARDFSNAPRLTPDPPLTEQLPDPNSQQGLFQLVTSWGLTLMVDENGDVNLVAYSQAGYDRNSQISEELATTKAELQAFNLIRMYINQTVAVQNATATSKNVAEFKNAASKAKLTSSTSKRFEQNSEARPINGLIRILDWNAVHPANSAPVKGVVVGWNASAAAGAIASKTRQNKVVKDQLRSPTNDGIVRGSSQRKTQQPVRRKGGLRGTTRSRDF